MTSLSAEPRRDTLRLVQVETFYGAYLEKFYDARPELRGASFAQQIDTLLKGGFSALHNIAPHLRDIGYESHFIIGNCAPAQIAWMRERGLPVPAGSSFQDVLRSQIEYLDPDVLYLSDALSFDARFIRTLRKRPRLVLAWHAAPIPAGVDWSEYDVLLSGLAEMRAMALRLGAKTAELYMPGFPEEIAAATRDVEERHDVVFAGSYTPVQHARRNELLVRLAEESEAGAFDCAFHLSGPRDGLPPALTARRLDPVFGLEMHRALAAGRIVFDCRSSMTGTAPDGRVYDIAGSESANMRLFEATGGGSFLLTHHYSNLSDYFRVGDEIETFRGEGELLEKVRYYLAHPEERRAIAARGRARCLADHAMSKRLPVFDAIVRRHLPGVPTMTVARPAPVVPRGARRYCTYFNGDYAPRALLMIESLRRFEPSAALHVLCLDETAARVIRDRAPGVEVTTLGELEAFDPQLAAAKSNRGAVEFFFTCTPCFPRYLLAKHPDTETITYLDADMEFHAHPDLIFAETGDASVAIVPHNFTPALASRVVYGVYNVSWVMWRNDDEGRRCLEEYRADCLEWCYDRLEGDRFADQKYLDRWPARYRGVHVIKGKGINLALWNVDNYALKRENGSVTVDGEPLILFHYHALKHIGPGSYDLRFGEYGVARNSAFLRDELYMPYLQRLNGLFEVLADGYGLTIKGDTRRRDATVASRGVLSGGYEIIDRAVALTVTDEAWLHDDVSAWQDSAYARILEEARQGRVRVDLAVAAEAVRATGIVAPGLLEIGCGSGYYADVFRLLLGGAVAYTGLDYSASMIDLARKKHPGGEYIQGDATSLPYEAGAFDIVFNGVSLMHIIDYEGAIAESRRVARRYCVFHTVPLLRQRQTMYLRKRAYGRAVVEVVLNEAELRLLFARHGLAVRRVWDSLPYDLNQVVGEPTPTRTFLCEVIEPISENRPALLNVGCGSRLHDDWVNIDIQPRSHAVLAHNIIESLPYPDETFDVVYHSHVLEHLPKARAGELLGECRRVLKPGGTLRVAIPDLERACREYLKSLERAASGDVEAGDRYDWILLELLDQMVRNRSGGEMVRFLARDPVPAHSYILERVGSEARGIIASVRAGGVPPESPEPTALEIGRFRLSGEIHQWMYDRFSLRRLLESVGFIDARVVDAVSSNIPQWSAYGLDAEADGAVRKPDSLFMEARKPAGGDSSQG